MALNKNSDRLAWVRGHLGLSMRQVAVGAKIPIVTYWERENGRRTTKYEEFLTLAVFLNGMWKKRFYKEVYPRRSGVTIERITVEWIMFGKDLSSDYLKTTILSMEQTFKAKELELNERCMGLEFELKKAKDKLDLGLITQDEFNAIKLRLAAFIK